MELNQAYKDIEKYLEQINQDLKFKKDFETESSVAFSGEKGIYRLVHDSKTNILSLECAYENNGEQTEFNTISRSLFELDVVDDRDIKSTSNEIVDELERLFKVRKPVNLDKVKMPKSVSRTKAKNGIVSYDIDLAELVYMAPSYLSSVFKKETGQNLSRFIKSVRMEKARELLEKTMMKIVDVSTACGYPNVSYFCSSFREYFGISPQKFRESGDEMIEEK